MDQCVRVVFLLSAARTGKIGVLCRISHSPAVVCFPKGFFSTLLRLNRAGDCIDRVWIEGLTKTGL
jgi:hypothetical protein